MTKEKLYAKKYYERNKELVKQKHKDHYNKNKEKILLRNKLNRDTNKEKIKEYHKKNYQEKKDHYLLLQKEYRKHNKERIVQKAKIYREKNKERIAKQKQEYLNQNNNREKRRVYYKKYRSKEENRVKIRQQYNNRIKDDINFRLRCCLKGRLLSVIKNQSATKKSKTLDLLGCSVEELKKYIESKFQPGMTWENHGLRGWHIDHIIPCSSFDLSLEENQQKCFHFTNLQPLWWEDNIKKGASLNYY